MAQSGPSMNRQRRNSRNCSASIPMADAASPKNPASSNEGRFFSEEVPALL